MKLFLISIFVHLPGFAMEKTNCLPFYRNGNALQFSPPVHEDFNKRLMRIFKSKWFRSNEHQDVYAAKRIVEKLQKYGSPIDYAIFDMYLKVLENSKGSFNLRSGGFYYDEWEAFRPKSNHFQHIHWDWTIFENYLFNSPRSVMLARQWDLEYLTFVNETAIKLGRERPLKAVLETADHAWALAQLNGDTAIKQQYLQYTQGRTHAALFKRFSKKVSDWVNESNHQELARERSRLSQIVLSAFKNATSAFDLMLMEKYFDITVRYKVEDLSKNIYDMVPRWVQLNDPLAIEIGLSYGSIKYLTDFIFQNAYNLKMKKYVMHVLNLIDSGPFKPRYQLGDFFSDFNSAYFQAHESLPVVIPPDQFKTDLHIYSRSLNPTEATVDSLERTDVFWNEEIGQLQVKTGEFYPVEHNKKATVRDHPQLRAYVETYFDQMKTSESFTSPELASIKESELNASLLDSTFFVFTKKSRTHLLSMARLYDGTKEKTYIEAEFPIVEFPERKTGESIFEIGRLLSLPEVANSSLELILARIAEHLYTKKASGMIYFDVKKSVRSMYLKRYKAEDVYTPQQLGIAPGNPQIWIMKMPVEKFIQIFYKPEFEAVRLRAGN